VSTSFQAGPNIALPRCQCQALFKGGRRMSNMPPRAVQRVPAINVLEFGASAVAFIFNRGTELGVRKNKANFRLVQARSSRPQALRSRTPSKVWDICLMFVLNFYHADSLSRIVFSVCSSVHDRRFENPCWSWPDIQWSMLGQVLCRLRAGGILRALREFFFRFFA
jgi:hypothetical protein